MNRKILFLLTLLVCLVSNAKVGKVKYGKYVVYEGEVVDKQPYGEGNLSIINPQDKEICVAEIHGFFKGNKINKATIKSHLCTTLSDISEATLEFPGEKGKCMHVDVIMENTDLTPQNAITSTKETISSIHLYDLTISFDLIDKNHDWSFTYKCNSTHEGKGIKCSFVPRKLSALLSSLNYSISDVSSVNETFELTSEKMYSLSPYPIYRLKDNTINIVDTIIYEDNSKVIVCGEQWTGKRVLSDGSSVTADGSKTLNIKYSNGDSYIGTVKENIMVPLYADTKKPSFTYVDGVEHKGNLSEKWINGESFTKRHKRLTETIDEDLVDSIENEIMTEAQAIEACTIRKKQSVEKISKLLSEGTVVFKCNSIGKTYSGSAAGMQEVGIFTGDLIYNVTLTLNSDHTGVLNYSLEPSESSFQNQTIHYKRNGEKQRHGDYVSEFCKILKDTETDQWSLDGDIITFGKKAFKISNNGQDLKWEFLELCTLTIAETNQQNKATNNSANIKTNTKSIPNSLVGRSYEGSVICGQITDYVDATMKVVFNSSTTATVTLTMSIKGSEGKTMEQIISMFGGDEDVFKPKVMKQTYSYKNGVVYVKDSTDKYVIKDGGKIIYWDVNELCNGNLYLKK